MGYQRDMFLRHEADAFHSRNRVDATALQDRIDADPLLDAFRKAELAPKRVLEIGAGDGWRLEALRRRNPVDLAVGIEPSRGACAEGMRRFPQVRLTCGTAEALPFGDRSFDLVILGFFLYVVDRDDLFRVAAEADRLVAEGGVVAILDFHPERPTRRPYRDVPACYSYKMNYGSMFDWNPAYRRTHHALSTHPGGRAGDPEDQIAVTLLTRDSKHAYADSSDIRSSDRGKEFE